MKEKKISEFRPEPCNSRIGDIVQIDGKLMLKIKCRRCTKAQGRDFFHYHPVSVLAGQ